MGTKSTDSGKLKETRSKQIFFSTFSGFLILILPIITYDAAQDTVLLPRFLVLTIFLTIFTLTFFILKKKTQIDLSLLRKPVFLLSGLYLLMVIVSGVFAFNPKESYFDIVRTYVFIVLVFYWMITIANSPSWVSILSKFMIITTTIASLTGLYQYFDQVAFSTADTLPDGRELIYAVNGLMAHKNFFTSHLMLMMPFLIWATFKLRGYWRFAAYTGLSLSAAIIILVATRAVWAGIMVSFLIFSVIVFIFHTKLNIPQSPFRKFSMISPAVLLVLGFLVIAGGNISENNHLKKLSSIVRPDEFNNQFRLKIWQITFDMALENPFTGVGAGNWQIKAPEHFRKIALQGKEVNWQTPHNDFLWILSEKGFIGLLLFLGLIALVSFYVFRIITGNGEPEKKILALLLFSGLVAYLTDSFFGFPYQRIDHLVYSALFIAGIAAIDHQQNPTKPLKTNPAIIGLMTGTFLICGIVYFYHALTLEIHVKKGYKYQNNGKYEMALQEYAKAETPFRNIDALGSPVDYYSGQSFYGLNDFESAVSSFTKAFDQHPNHIGLLNNIGSCYLKTGNVEQAKKYYLKALEIVPDLKETRSNLSSIYYQEGNYDKSLEMLQGIKNKKKFPKIKKNMKVLQSLLGLPEDTLNHKNKPGKNKKGSKK